MTPHPHQQNIHNHIRHGNGSHHPASNDSKASSGRLQIEQGPSDSHRVRAADESTALVVRKENYMAAVPHTHDSAKYAAFNQVFKERTVAVAFGAYKGLSVNLWRHAAFFIRTLSSPIMVMMFYSDPVNGQVLHAGMGMQGPDGNKAPYNYPSFDRAADAPAEVLFLGKTGHHKTDISARELAEIQRIIQSTPCAKIEPVVWASDVAKALQDGGWLREDPDYGWPSYEISSLKRHVWYWFDIGILKAYNIKTGGALNLAFSMQCISPIRDTASVFSTRLKDTKRVKYGGVLEDQVKNPTNWQPAGFDRPGEFLFIQRLRLGKAQEQYIDNLYLRSEMQDNSSRKFVMKLVEKLEDKDILTKQPPKCDKRFDSCSELLRSFAPKIDVKN